MGSAPAPLSSLISPPILSLQVQGRPDPLAVPQMLFFPFRAALLSLQCKYKSPEDLVKKFGFLFTTWRKGLEILHF